ncbi:putative lipoprotein [Corallococcus coralloides DSM 2259]|uniref:Putative lipoprotein n=1 Tax=Corallococcus coralloides (strain ATCC 25202 / DSM 2259 / NBRC 100086 / M2) TaxID=1144275 RepID=H8MWX1_CORCM|nr:hypothetical protein [Corallococcus coralloides]AFE04137.1 putative lipoprotein [Corallococcus coralloides DSM 2259]
MKRSLSGLLVALAFTACKQEAPGKLEPIPRPPGATAPEPEEAAPVPAAPAVPKDAVVLRWKLVQDAPISFRLNLALDRNAAVPESAPAPKAAKADKKKGAKAAPASEAPKAAAKAPVPTEYMYVLVLDKSGERQLRVTPNAGVGEDATFSDRGFIIDGLQGPARNLATLVLELPRDPVRPGETWSLGTELTTPDALGTLFRRAPGGERHNRVKLVSVTPGDNGEQVATLEYDIVEQFGGTLSAPRPALPKKDKGAKQAGPENAAIEVPNELDDTPAPAAQPEGTELGATVKVTGKGEFLVKAGQWRSWQGTLSTSLNGPAQPAVNLPVGTYQARVSPVGAPQQAPQAPQAPETPAPTATPPAP